MLEKAVECDKRAKMSHMAENNGLEKVSMGL